MFKNKFSSYKYTRNKDIEFLLLGSLVIILGWILLRLYSNFSWERPWSASFAKTYTFSIKMTFYSITFFSFRYHPELLFLLNGWLLIIFLLLFFIIFLTFFTFLSIILFLFFNLVLNFWIRFFTSISKAVKSKNLLLKARYLFFIKTCFINISITKVVPDISRSNLSRSKTLSEE